MHINRAKEAAVLGVMAALSTVFTVLGTIISVNTVFFTSAAAFLVGIAVISYGMGAGTLFYFVCLILDFFFNPDKFHVFLYMGLAGYILLSEGIYRGMKKMRDGKKKEWIHRGIRFLIFAGIYTPLLLCIPRLLVNADMIEKPWFLPGMFGVGIAAWVIFDLAYLAAKKWLFERFGRIML